MRILLIGLLMGHLWITSTVLLAQEPVSNRSDTSLDALISRVEGKPESTSFVNQFQPGEPFQKRANELVETYYKALLKNDLIAAYGCMSKLYRNIVSLQVYLRKERVTPSKVLIKSLNFKGKTCAQARGTIKGLANAKLGDISLPIKLKIYLEGESWVIFDNPYVQLGFSLPKADSVKYPCKF